MITVTIDVVRVGLAFGAALLVYVLYCAVRWWIVERPKRHLICERD